MQVPDAVSFRKNAKNPEKVLTNLGKGVIIGTNPQWKKRGKEAAMGVYAMEMCMCRTRNGGKERPSESVLRIHP